MGCVKLCLGGASDWARGQVSALRNSFAGLLGHGVQRQQAAQQVRDCRGLAPRRRQIREPARGWLASGAGKAKRGAQ